MAVTDKFGSMLSDTELYELSECYELSNLDKNTQIDEVVNTYGQLQLNPAKMVAARNSEIATGESWK